MRQGFAPTRRAVLCARALNGYGDGAQSSRSCLGVPPEPVATGLWWALGLSLRRGSSLSSGRPSPFLRTRRCVQRAGPATVGRCWRRVTEARRGNANSPLRVCARACGSSCPLPVRRSLPAVVFPAPTIRANPLHAKHPGPACPGCQRNRSLIPTPNDVAMRWRVSTVGAFRHSSIWARNARSRPVSLARVCCDQPRSARSSRSRFARCCRCSGGGSASGTS